MGETPPTRRDFLKASGIVLAAGLAGLSGWGYMTRVEPAMVELTRLRTVLPRLDPAFDGYRLVQISDIHMDEWMTRRRLEDIVSQVNQLDPDLVAVTGDFITDARQQYLADLVFAMSKLRGRDGVVAVLGNHDYWSDHSFVRLILKGSGIKELPNQVLSLARGDARLHICGVDCSYEGHDRLDQVLEQLPEQGAAILMVHEPDFADTSAATGRFDLQISGHSHGGQVVLPFVGPLILPPHAHKYPSGLYNINGMLHYTNRGLGMVHFHLRLNCRPEITLI